MKISKDIIGDLFPLYVANECSADTRALIAEYLQANPREAEELSRIMSNPLKGSPPPAVLDELRSLREARRRLRRRSWLFGLALFFSLLPFSFFYDGTRTWWFLLEAPKWAIAYGLIGVACWIALLTERYRFRGL